MSGLLGGHGGEGSIARGQGEEGAISQRKMWFGMAWPVASRGPHWHSAPRVKWHQIPSPTPIFHPPMHGQPMPLTRPQQAPEPGCTPQDAGWGCQALPLVERQRIPFGTTPRGSLSVEAAVASALRG